MNLPRINDVQSVELTLNFNKNYLL